MTSALAQSRIRLDRDVLREFCRRHHIAKLSLFGSVLREDFRPDSDIDVLVEFEPGNVPGYVGLAAVALELDALMGREVDLHTPASLSPSLRDDVVASAVTLYAAD
jgi:predicted nucleotidyltransferase